MNKVLLVNGSNRDAYSNKTLWIDYTLCIKGQF